MQNDMFKPEEDLEMHWEILEVKYGEPSWNAQNKVWEKFVLEIVTQPIGWIPPLPDDSVPW